ncbi:hypothetical protein QBC42DRAFT_213626 [Cladorrhinum samala]|uniref:Zn(2)-C6 fungal-type domain-containing protein n=1 Tax=Cladorrhinum samala TaxID=585594 RepID=A0AAV9H9A2_9PEZI|nr:hypothetical protein QBC42DRAFT_213626 [Cladorrhinum samala]
MAAVTPMRQSCDRCHGQKLRCQRTGDGDTGACQRCIRQGSQCVYSTSLPKGRPSQYSQSQSQTDQGGSAAPSTFPAPKRQCRAATPTSPKPKVPKRPGLGSRTSTTLSNTACQWPSLGPDLPYQHDPFPDPFAGSNEPHKGHVLDWTDVSSGMTSHLQPAQTHFTAQFDFYGFDSGLKNQPAEHTEGTPSLFSADSVASNAQDPGIGIAQLTQLSTRLYPLHRSAMAAAELASSREAKYPPGLKDTKDQKPPRRAQDPIVDKSGFKSIMTRLLHGFSDAAAAASNQATNAAPDQARPICDTMQDAFTASKQFLGILHCLQGQAKSGSVSSDSSRQSPMTPISISTPTAGCSGINGSAGQHSSSQYSNTVTRHLVMACHGMLLSIYAAILGVLQRDADLMSSDGHHDAKVSGIVATGLHDTEAATLTDMRLVMVVQLCSYLIGRQQQAVAPHVSTLQQRDGATGDEALLGSNDVDMDVPPNDLEVEVQQRLCQLRDSLRIS